MVTKSPPAQPRSSKRMIIVGIIVFAIIIGVILITHKSAEKIAEAKHAAVLAQTFEQAVNQSSNGNGIPDWEQELFGLDPTANGAKNLAIINAKKATLAAEAAEAGETSDSSSTPSATDEFTQDFFATVFSLNQSNNLTPETITALAIAASNQIASDSQSKYQTQYTDKDIKLAPTNDNPAIVAYAKSLVALAKKYQAQNVGIEMESVSIALSQNDPRPLLALPAIATSYANFSKDLLALSVPQSLLSTDLDLVNSTDVISRALPDMAQILVDPITALPAIAAYSKQETIFTNAINQVNELF